MENFTKVWKQSKVQQEIKTYISNEKDDNNENFQDSKQKYDNPYDEYNLTYFEEGN